MPPSPPTISQGDTGLAVRTWQQLLASKGFVITVDGIFGPKTLSATKVAQAWAHVDADGIVGPITWYAVAHTKRQHTPLVTISNTVHRDLRVIDVRRGQNGFSIHPYRKWNKRSRSDLQLIVGHYTGGPGTFQADSVFHTRSDYLTPGGAPAIAYHLGVDKNGTVFLFNNWDAVTWHCDGGKNTISLGVVFRGGAEGPNILQRRQLKRIYHELRIGVFRPVPYEPRWPKITQATTHRHVRATTCPGERGEAFYQSL